MLDEVTYPLHIILRYEIEKEFIEAHLIAYLPEAWNAKMTQYLGLSTKNNFKDGVMQDVHWPAAVFGYFPAYTLGSLIAAQLFATAKHAHPKMLAEIAQGNFTTLFSWLNKNLHSKGSSLHFNELLKEATGKELNSEYFIKHIKSRYLGGDA